MDERDKTPGPELPQPEAPRDEPPKEPIHWATRGQRMAAWIAAICVILITIAYIYSIFTGELFFR